MPMTGAGPDSRSESTGVLEGWAEGQRVIDEDGFRGTVRYIGPVATSKDAKAVWIGVEWDDPTRGKHDGSVVKQDGTVVRHFTCVHPHECRTNASFVKPNKLDRGVGFMEVLRQRYVTLDAPLLAPNQLFEGAYANTSKGGQKPIEFHGEEKIRRYQQIPVLEKVSMRGERVSSAGEAVAEEAAHLVEVDVQGNLLCDWDEVARLARQMPRLQVLHLNSNRMLPLLRAPSSSSFSCLRTLILNSCGLTSWATVAHLEPCLPALEELALAQNDLSDMDRVNDGPVVRGFANLRSLDLSGTRLSRWAGQVSLFSRLPHLRALHLNENALQAVLPPQTPQDFAALESVHLSANLIDSWASVDALHRYPALVSLRFTNNPLVRTMGQSEARQLLIARVAGLTRLNGAEVSKKERAEAEKSYVRRVMRAMAALGEEGEADGPGGRKALLLADNPRWPELRALHGEAMYATGGAEGTGSLASEMLPLRLVSMASVSMTAAPVEKRLPGSMLVSQLKQLLAKLYKVEPEMQVLKCRSDKSSLPTVLDRDDESLAYFGLMPGWEVIVNEVDLKQRAREEEQRKKDEQQRLEEQMRQVEVMSQIRRAQVTAETTSVQQQAAKGGAASSMPLQQQQEVL